MKKLHSILLLCLGLLAVGIGVSFSLSADPGDARNNPCIVGEWECKTNGLQTQGELDFYTKTICLGETIDPPVEATASTFSDGVKVRDDCPEPKIEEDDDPYTIDPDGIIFHPAWPEQFLDVGEQHFDVTIDATAEVCDDLGVLYRPHVIITVVEVASVSGEDVTSETDSPGEEETIYVCQGGSASSSIRLTATANPDVEFPENEPTWANADGNGATADFDITTPATDADGELVTVTCGISEKSINVFVVEVEKVSYEPEEYSWVTSETDTPGENETVYVSVGDSASSTITLTAKSNFDVDFPDGGPTWVNADAVAGTKTATFDISTVSNSVDGTTVEVHCGDSVKKIKVVVVEVASVSIEEVISETDTPGDAETYFTANDKYDLPVEDQDSVTLTISAILNPNISKLPDDAEGWDLPEEEGEDDGGGVGVSALGAPALTGSTGTGSTTGGTEDPSLTVADKKALVTTLTVKGHIKDDVKMVVGSSEKVAKAAVEGATIVTTIDEDQEEDEAYIIFLNENFDEGINGSGTPACYDKDYTNDSFSLANEGDEIGTVNFEIETHGDTGAKITFTGEGIKLHKKDGGIVELGAEIDVSVANLGGVDVDGLFIGELRIEGIGKGVTTFKATLKPTHGSDTGEDDAQVKVVKLDLLDSGTLEDQDGNEECDNSMIICKSTEPGTFGSFTVAALSPPLAGEELTDTNLALTFPSTVNLWEDAAGKIPYGTSEYSVNRSNLFYIEGASASSTELDVEIEAEVVFNSGVVAHDKLKYTVIDLLSLLPDQNTLNLSSTLEIDDRDGSDKTRVFFVQKEASVSLSVFADFDPSIAGELPSLFSLTGGSRLTSLARRIDRSATGIFEIIASCNSVELRKTTIIVYEAEAKFFADKGSVRWGTEWPYKRIGVGHTWWEMKLEPANSKKYLTEPQQGALGVHGYWPTLDNIGVGQFTSDGLLRVDQDGHPVTGTYSRKITIDKFFDGLSYVNFIKTTPGQYNLFAKNCTSVASGLLVSMFIILDEWNYAALIMTPVGFSSALNTQRYNEL